MASQQSNEGNEVAKANWDYKSSSTFLDCVIAEIDKGNRPFKYITPIGWNGIIASFFKDTGRKHDIKQVKNKYDSLKKYWDAWMVLHSPNNVCIGLGYDAKNNLVTGPDHWWDKMIVLNKNVIKFRDRGLDHEEKMHQVFGAVTNTGRRAWNMSKTRMEGDNMKLLDEDDELVLLESGDRQLVEVSGKLALMNETQISVESSGFSEPAITSPMKVKYKLIGGPSRNDNKENEFYQKEVGGKRKCRATENNISTAIGKMVEDHKVALSNSFTVETENGPSGCAVKDCLQKLSTVEGMVEGDARYMFSLKLMKKDVINRELIMGLPSDELLLKWLDDEKIEYDEDKARNARFTF